MTESHNPKQASITPLGVRMSPDLRDKVKQISERNRRSMNSEIVIAIERHIAAEEGK